MRATAIGVLLSGLLVGNPKFQALTRNSGYAGLGPGPPQEEERRLGMGLPVQRPSGGARAAVCSAADNAGDRHCNQGCASLGTNVLN